MRKVGNAKESLVSNKPASDAPTSTVDGNKSSRWKWILLLVLAVGLIVVLTQYRSALTLKSLAQQESQLREYQQANPYLVYAIAFLVYVGVTGFSFPGAAALTLVFGWYFGFLEGLLMVSFASAGGATMAFLISRFFLRESIQSRFGEKLTRFNQALEQDGSFYLFTLRLIPAVPFFMINAVMGLTPIKTRTFWWVSQLGMLPGTAIYVYAGSRVPNLQTLADKGIGAVFTPSQLLQIVVAFALLGLFPLLARYTLKFFSKTNNHSSADGPEINA